ncbi:MAG: hypothetical protein UV71_C0012G0021 [Microgenomates group bacterium GW2011_GWC1_43_13]|uniref:YokE-like PH domain-containing protein n=3 Tax=Candidatus Woeseibacteriota TaxID=1752722 RepID=A0A837IDV9_9BACT|nr:MAG: hypothetical protein UV71_C0012G0021 [Microgenomates group bacterium GW2011_GWC1_43_13]KKT33099.1 MAG: hypothetical protein UW20_C0005G0031 [Candidatus Woesebacteria bacterium GW2011_GWB1_44_11]KKT54761.1 MAG: hypothetical protein UW47_C0003G0030 [Candidatus Woesebacteria bacterium GW2011_GWA1_44_23]OGM76330.1 MAG: hypothetical protein A2208_01120 [Candidatus Woesebacteria bacterium RIFOXYA1_FULL_43_16]OGM81537.1 MAG: hypothetical protein A2394_01070 [Candidatus Woesebacteria bacterium 
METKIYDQKGSVNVVSEKLKIHQEETRAVKKQERAEVRAVAKLVKKSNRILVSVSSHRFPFDPFPDILNIEEGRITIINRHIFSSEVHSVDIKDISNIFINTVVFFSQLVIISKTFEENEIKIANLRTKEAVLARRIIEGLRIFENKQIDTSGYTVKELVAKLKELSTTKIVT